MSQESGGHAWVVTPHNTTPLEQVTSRIYIGGTGTLTVTMASGVDVLFSALPVGTILPIRCTHVKSTGTTATLIVAIAG